jgi:hypothetical protein
MSIERSTETPPDAASLANVICLCVVALLIAAAWRFRRSLPETAGGFAWTIIALAPFCGFFFLYQGMAERYAYLASIGLALAITREFVTGTMRRRCTRHRSRPIRTARCC